MNRKISNTAQVASVRRYTLTDGREAGIQVVDCDNGKVRFLINISHGLDIMQLYHEGQNMSFVSKNGFVNENISFLSRFEGGMIYTCGLDNVGAPKDNCGQHGSYHTTPAELVSAVCDGEKITVEGIVRYTALFGANLVMRRKITSYLGSSEVKIEDTLTNEGYKSAEYCLLYHTNIGYPMLDADARVECDPVTIKGSDDRSESFIDVAFKMTEPEDEREEECFFLKLREPKVSLVNEKIGKRFTVDYSGDTLTELVLWRSMVSGDYALGIEPATTTLGEDFKRNTLGVRESVSFFVSLSVDKL